MVVFETVVDWSPKLRGVKLIKRVGIAMILIAPSIRKLISNTTVLAIRNSLGLGLEWGLGLGIGIGCWSR
jgi:hypothetical protein